MHTTVNISCQMQFMVILIQPSFYTVKKEMKNVKTQKQKANVVMSLIGHKPLMSALCFIFVIPLNDFWCINYNLLFLFIVSSSF